MMVQKFGPGAFRLFLAGMVVFSHLLPVETGRVAVAGFFTLSGYWVTRMYRRKYSHQPHHVLHFYATRALRIYPVYFAALIGSLLALAALGQSKPFHLYDWTLLNFAAAPDRVLNPAWSLNIELQFYLLVPLLLWLVGGAPSRGRLVALFGAALAATFVYWTWLTRFEASVFSYLLPFAVGMIAAIRPVPIDKRLAWGSVAAFALVGLLLLIIPAGRPMLFKNFDPAAVLVPREVVSMLWGAVALPFILWTVQQPGGRLDRIMGELAYTLYLAHWIPVTRNGAIFGFLPGQLPKLAGVSCAVLATLLLYVFVDRPVERLRRHLFDKSDHMRATLMPAHDLT